MLIDKTINQPDDSDQGPKPPSNPVEFARWVQRPKLNPKVQPDDSALRPEALKKPEINRSIGTDIPNALIRKTRTIHGYQVI